jgi:hypothetical protein
MGEREMIEQLNNIDPARLTRKDVVITWKELAEEVGVSDDSLQRRCLELGINLPRWGPRRTSPVFLPRGKIVILKTLYFA